MTTSIQPAIASILTPFLIAAHFICAAPAASAASPTPVSVDHGPEWDAQKRDEFYSLDQGSHIMPLAWIKALKAADGSPFMADSLQRYGYLPNDASPAKLPVGFTASGLPGKESIGMTCAACHTRQVEHDGKSYRIDGGPAMADFQALMSDLDAAVGSVINSAPAFADFARSVLGTAHGPEDAKTLRQTVSDWHVRNTALMSHSLPKANSWGPGRLDAVSMIFNRLTGLALGGPPTYLIPNNIKLADVPVRYPFLWNASKQDKTQWAGFASNDNEFVRLGRNVGQALGVFALFRPVKDGSPPNGINYMAENSVNFENLKRLEILTTFIGPPRWPWPLDQALAAKGAKIYDTECATCHGTSSRPTPWETKIEPIDDVRTDYRQLVMLQRTASAGVLAGAAFPLEIPPLGNEDAAGRILLNAVLGSLFNFYFPPLPAPPRGDVEAARSAIEDARKRSAEPAQKPGFEARVLDGVWAAAPYLHNGSVPTLADLLKPAAERTPSFKVGPAYDPKAVGLASEQTHFGAVLTTTDCSDRGSGNSRCGHEYGTTLDRDQKAALLEYLKKL